MARFMRAIALMPHQHYVLRRKLEIDVYVLTIEDSML